MPHTKCLFAGLVIFASPVGVLAQPAKLSLEQLERRASGLMPSREQLRYQDIPWVHDLAEAQAIAQKERRPIFLWGYGGRARPDNGLEGCSMYANVLRAGTLADERVARRITDHFVPTHFNNNDPTRDRKSPSAVLWHSIVKQKELQGQGIWIVAPDGNVLAGMSAEINGKPSDRKGNGPGAPWQPNRRFADAAVEMLDSTLKLFGPVSRRNVKPQPLPFRGAGIKPDGSVRLVAYNRADHGLVFSVNLSKADWEAFAPPKLALNERWTLPESVARQFAPALSPYADTRFRPWPDDLDAAELTAQVETLNAKQARVRLTGRWQGDWKHDGNEESRSRATADGILVIDAITKKPQSLLMVFDGTYSYANPSRPHKPEPLAAFVRWRLDGDAE